MHYSVKTYGDFTEETWELETGYEVRLLTWHGHKVTLTISEGGYTFLQHEYGFWQHSQAQQHAEALARMGQAGVSVAA